MSINADAPDVNVASEPNDVVTALARGLDILRCFDRPRLQLTVSQISRLVGLSQPTTWRLCRTLMSRGFLVRSQNSKAFRVGAPALTLGFAAIKGLSVPALAAPYMQELTNRYGCSTTLSVRHSMEIVSIESCYGHFLEPNQPVGWRAALTSTASGLALLAVLPPNDRAEMLKLLKARDRQAWPRRYARIDKADRQYGAEGFVSFAGLNDGFYTAVAVPIIEGSGEQITYWAMSCGGVSSRWNAESLQKAGADLVETRTLLQPALAMMP